MTENPFKLFKRCSEFIPIDNLDAMPHGLRGIYALYRYSKSLDRYNVVLIGGTRIGGRGLRSKLKKHRRDQPELWTHCAIFEVGPEVREADLEELVAVLMHIYKHDGRAEAFSANEGSRRLKTIQDRAYWAW